MRTDDPMAQRANALLATMTLEEKAGQLSQYFYMGGWTTQNELVEAQVRAGHAGSLLFVAQARETNRLQRIAVEQSRLGIPLLFGFDVIHGLRTIAPSRSAWPPPGTRHSTSASRRWRREARAVGIHWALADDRPATLGPWVFAPDLASTVTILEGLRRTAGDGVRVAHAPGLPVPTRTIPSANPALAALPLVRATILPSMAAARMAL